MIFVTTGTCEPFDRLLEALDGAGLDERLVVQHGESPIRPAGAECVDFFLSMSSSSTCATRESS